MDGKNWHPVITIDGVELVVGDRYYVVIREGVVLVTDAPPSLGERANGVYVLADTGGWRRAGQEGDDDA